MGSHETHYYALAVLGESAPNYVGLTLIAESDTNVEIKSPFKDLEINSHVDAHDDISISVDTGFLIVSSGLQTVDKGILIESDNTITVQMDIQHSEDNIVGFKGFEITEDFTDFIIPASRDGAHLVHAPIVAVVAITENTVITVQKKATVGYQSGNTYTLNKYDVLSLSSVTAFSEYLGALIHSTYPVAVYSGHTCSKVYDTAPPEYSCDAIIISVPPLSSLGKDHIIPPTAGRDIYTKSIVQVLAAYDETDVNVFDSYYNKWIKQTSLSKGRDYQTLIMAYLATGIKCSKPCLVVQYNPPKEYDISGSGFDTFAMLVPPIKHYSQHAYITSLSFPSTLYISVIARYDEIDNFNLLIQQPFSYEVGGMPDYKCRSGQVCSYRLLKLKGRNI